ncbi:MAG TPA: TolC family protein [Flavipsychrobacter sp.]
MRQLLYTVSLITIMLPQALKAQEAGEPLKLSLEEAMDLAVKNNVQAKNARLDINKQKAVNAEVSGLALPNIKAKGEFNDYINPIQSFVPAEFIGGPPGTFVAVPFTPKFSSTASVTGTQILFDGSVMVALQARNALMRLYEQSSILTDEEIRYNIQKAYQAIVVAHRQSKILDESIAFARSIANDFNAMYEAGFVEKIEADRIMVQVNNLASDSLKVHNMLDVSMQMLKYQMGIDNEMNIQLTDTSIEEQIEDAEMLMLRDLNFAKRTDYNLLHTQLKLNEYDLKRHKLSGLPSLAVFGSAAYTYASNTFGDVFDKQYIFYSLVGVQLNIPIFDGLQRHNRVKQAKISVMQTRNNIENLELGIAFQKNQSTTQLNNALLTMRNEQRNLDLAKNVLRLAREKYKAGVGSNMEVSQAQTEMLRAQNNYFQALLDAANAKADLKKALGEY